jgi:hypothetical protein
MRQGRLFLELTRRAPALLLLLATAPVAADDAAGAPCTQADELPAVDLAEPALLSSPLHLVAPCARVVGHLAQFRIDTRWGPLVADSLELLRIRVAELPAVEELERASHARLAAKSAEDSVRRIGSTVESVATRPVETLKALPEGALRFFRAKLDDLGETLQAVGDRAGEQLAGAGEAYDRVSTRPGVVLHDAPAEPWWERGGDRLWRLGKDWIGYGDTRRTWAQRLGVDPYSSNPLLNERMDSLAWAALAGDKAVGLATGELGSTAGKALGTTQRINRVVWDLPPIELRRRNDQRLAALACGEEERRRFLRNGRFTPTLQTALVDALVELQPSRGCVDVIELAAALDVEVEVRYLVDALALLAGEGITDGELLLVGSAPMLRHVPAAPRDALARDLPDEMIARVPPREPTALDALAARQPAAPRLVLPLPVDRLEWSESTAAFFDVAPLRVVDKRVLIGGTATPNALQGLTRRGWEISEHARDPDSMAIRDPQERRVRRD